MNIVEYNNNNNCNDVDIDSWNTSINDDKFIVTNKIIRIFPQLKNNNYYSKLQIDDESLSFITIREIADLTSKIICHHLIKYNINPLRTSIVDYTAGVGGNVLSFGKFFNQVYAIEIMKNRFDYLQNNINVYGYKNILCINDSSINFTYNELTKINQCIIFIDPPWGGGDYKNVDTIKLKLDNIEIEKIIIDILYIFSTNEVNNLKELTKYSDNLSINSHSPSDTFENKNKFIVLKLPKNYDIEYLYYYIKNNNIQNYNISMYIYILNKMLIFVCEFINISLN